MPTYTFPAVYHAFLHLTTIEIYRMKHTDMILYTDVLFPMVLSAGSILYGALPFPIFPYSCLILEASITIDWQAHIL